MHLIPIIFVLEPPSLAQLRKWHKRGLKSVWRPRTRKSKKSKCVQKLPVIDETLISLTKSIKGLTIQAEKQQVSDKMRKFFASFMSVWGIFLWLINLVWIEKSLRKPVKHQPPYGIQGLTREKEIATSSRRWKCQCLMVQTQILGCFVLTFTSKFIDYQRTIR